MGLGLFTQANNAAVALPAVTTRWEWAAEC